MQDEKILILDFGGQYKELIARRVRELGVYCEIRSGDMTAAEIAAEKPIGLIFTGGPDSVYLPESPQCDPAIFGLGLPVLGICYGMQLLCRTLGGSVAPGTVREYGRVAATLDGGEPLFEGAGGARQVLMSHTDRVTRLPEGFHVTASTPDCPIAAAADPARRFYGLQFHPEVELTDKGKEIFRNFLYKICGAKGDYTMTDFIRKQTEEIKAQVGGDKVLLALSGGVDSAVCAVILSKAIPGQLVCIFVDHGFMRKDEGDQIEAAFKGWDLEFVRIDAEQRFLGKLAGVTDPEQKRKIIGAEFVAVFDEQAKAHGDCKWLAQGTIYPDIVESGAKGDAKIKSHHNVGGLPEHLNFKGLVEPLRTLFKDEVRAVGRELGLPEQIVSRQPFPGPGLAVRCIGELTKPKLDILREADAIWRGELEAAGVKASQYFAVLTDLRSVGVMGDGRTYDYTIALRAVTTSDFMTAEYTRVPHEVLAKASSRITAEVRGVNRVVFDITSKPPATIEYE